MTKQEDLRAFVFKTASNYNINRFKSDKSSEICILATMVGPLRVKKIESDRYLSTIVMSFDNIVDASRYFDCNIETGDWTIKQRKIEDAKYLFDFYMNRVANLRNM